jgi:hypothetical protein
MKREGTERHERTGKNGRKEKRMEIRGGDEREMR